MSHSIGGKTAIVTGAGSGINLAFAEQLLNGGCNVLFADLALRPEAQKLVDAYPGGVESKSRAVFQQTDVTNWTHLERIFERAEEEFGEIDIVCPGAGVYEPSFSSFWYPPGTPQSKDALHGGRYASIDINLIHPIRTTQLALSRFLRYEKKPRTIVIISSTNAQDTCLSTAIYDATKHAISGFVRAMAKIDQVGVRIAAVAPGIIKTPLFMENPEKLAMIDTSKDVLVEPSEVASVMVALVERDSICSTIDQASTGPQDIEIKSGSIIEVTKNRARVVNAYHDPGPSGAGAVGSNFATSEYTTLALLLTPGWGEPSVKASNISISYLIDVRLHAANADKWPTCKGVRDAATPSKIKTWQLSPAIFAMADSTPHQVTEGHLRPRLSKLTMVAMTFAILNTWIALGGTIGIVMPSGGPVALLYGFIFCVACNFALAFSLAMFIAAAIVVASGRSTPVDSWTTYLVFLAIITFSTIVNIWGNSILGPWSNFALYWSILSVVIISIILLSMSEKTSAEFVFTTFNNETGWSDGMAWLLGLLQSALSLIGFDAVLHMTEEMPNPHLDAPLAIVYAIGVGGSTGLIFILVILFCLTDVDKVVSSPTGQPLIALFDQATNSRAASTIISCMLGLCFIHGTNGSITTTSRLIYSMARDNGFFFSRYFNHINPKLEVPVRTIIFTYIFNVLFGALYLGPTVAFNAFIASCTILLNISYAFPIFVLVIRGRGILAPHQHPHTPWKLGNFWGYLVNWTACLYVSVTSVLFCFPPSLHVTGNTMNYVSVVIAICCLAIAIYWIARGKTFEGPNLETIMAQREEVAHAPGHGRRGEKEDIHDHSVSA
ncbi:amino acid permease-domain-containing protein [Fusarium oxysporum]|nr:amino acid permease-domain-containing protein [Fusarium oxysporum]